MKTSIFSEKDSKILEKAILKHGRILNISDLIKIFEEEYSKSGAHKRIQLLSKSGWLRRLKKGLYLIIDSFTARSQIDLSLLSIANALLDDSYVSLAHALNYYQMFDQGGAAVVSVTWREGKKFTVDQHLFQFSKVKKDMYFGFTEQFLGGKSVRVAETEKALIDYLYLDKSFGSASLVFEKLRDHHRELDLAKLQNYAIRSGHTVVRKIGFMLDTLKLNSAIAYQTIQNNRGSSRLTRDAKTFNAKWRLYYDDRIIG